MPEGATYTYADLVRDFPVDNVQREILDGELIVPGSPNIRHQRIVMRLGLAFSDHLRLHGGGEVFFVNLDTVLSEDNVVQPDVFFVADDRQDILTEKNVQGAPSLTVEVVSDSRRDRVRKRDIYARFGVPEYWVIDPDADRVEVHHLQGDFYGRPEIIGPGESLTYAPLPGLRIDLAELFAR